MNFLLKFLMLGGKYVTRITAQSIIEAYNRSVALGGHVTLQYESLAMAASYDNMLEMYNDNLEEIGSNTQMQLAFISDKHKAEFESYLREIETKGNLKQLGDDVHKLGKYIDVTNTRGRIREAYRRMIPTSTTNVIEEQFSKIEADIKKSSLFIAPVRPDSADVSKYTSIVRSITPSFRISEYKNLVSAKKDEQIRTEAKPEQVSDLKNEILWKREKEFNEKKKQLRQYAMNKKLSNDKVRPPSSPPKTNTEPITHAETNTSISVEQCGVTKLDVQKIYSHQSPIQTVKDSRETKETQTELKLNVPNAELRPFEKKSIRLNDLEIQYLHESANTSYAKDFTNDFNLLSMKEDDFFRRSQKSTTFDKGTQPPKQKTPIVDTWSLRLDVGPDQFRRESEKEAALIATNLDMYNKTERLIQEKQFKENLKRIDSDACCLLKNLQSFANLEKFLKGKLLMDRIRKEVNADSSCLLKNLEGFAELENRLSDTERRNSAANDASWLLKNQESFLKFETEVNHKYLTESLGRMNMEASSAIAKNRETFDDFESALKDKLLLEKINNIENNGAILEKILETFNTFEMTLEQKILQERKEAVKLEAKLIDQNLRAFNFYEGEIDDKVFRKKLKELDTTSFSANSLDVFRSYEEKLEAMKEKREREERRALEKRNLLEKIDRICEDSEAFGNFLSGDKNELNKIFEIRNDINSKYEKMKRYEELYHFINQRAIKSRLDAADIEGKSKLMAVNQAFFEKRETAKRMKEIKMENEETVLLRKLTHKMLKLIPFQQRTEKFDLTPLPFEYKLIIDENDVKTRGDMLDVNRRAFEELEKNIRVVKIIGSNKKPNPRVHTKPRLAVPILKDRRKRCMHPLCLNVKFSRPNNKSPKSNFEARKYTTDSNDNNPNDPFKSTSKCDTVIKDPVFQLNEGSSCFKRLFDKYNQQKKIKDVYGLDDWKQGLEKNVVGCSFLIKSEDVSKRKAKVVEPLKNIRSAEETVLMHPVPRKMWRPHSTNVLTQKIIFNDNLDGDNEEEMQVKLLSANELNECSDCNMLFIGNKQKFRKKQKPLSKWAQHIRNTRKAKSEYASKNKNSAKDNAANVKFGWNSGKLMQSTNKISANKEADNVLITADVVFENQDKPKKNLVQVASTEELSLQFDKLVAMSKNLRHTTTGNAKNLEECKTGSSPSFRLQKAPNKKDTLSCEIKYKSDDEQIEPNDFWARDCTKNLEHKLGPTDESRPKVVKTKSHSQSSISHKEVDLKESLMNKDIGKKSLSSIKTVKLDRPKNDAQRPQTNRELSNNLEQPTNYCMKQNSLDKHKTGQSSEKSEALKVVSNKTSNKGLVTHTNLYTRKSASTVTSDDISTLKSDPVIKKKRLYVSDRKDTPTREMTRKCPKTNLLKYKSQNDLSLSSHEENSQKVNSSTKLEKNMTQKALNKDNRINNLSEDTDSSQGLFDGKKQSMPEKIQPSEECRVNTDIELNKKKRTMLLQLQKERGKRFRLETDSKSRNVNVGYKNVSLLGKHEATEGWESFSPRKKLSRSQLPLKESNDCFSKYQKMLFEEDLGRKLANLQLRNKTDIVERNILDLPPEKTKLVPENTNQFENTSSSSLKENKEAVQQPKILTSNEKQDTIEICNAKHSEITKNSKILDINDTCETPELGNKNVPSKETLESSGVTKTDSYAEKNKTYNRNLKENFEKDEKNYASIHKTASTSRGKEFKSKSLSKLKQHQLVDTKQTQYDVVKADFEGSTVTLDKNQFQNNIQRNTKTDEPTKCMLHNRENEFPQDILQGKNTKDDKLKQSTKQMSFKNPEASKSLACEENKDPSSSNYYAKTVPSKNNKVERTKSKVCIASDILQILSNKVELTELNNEDVIITPIIATTTVDESSKSSRKHQEKEVIREIQETKIGDESTMLSQKIIPSKDTATTRLQKIIPPKNVVSTKMLEHRREKKLCRGVQKSKSLDLKVISHLQKPQKIVQLARFANNNLFESVQNATRKNYGLVKCADLEQSEEKKTIDATDNQTEKLIASKNVKSCKSLGPRIQKEINKVSEIKVKRSESLKFNTKIPQRSVSAKKIETKKSLKCELYSENVCAQDFSKTEKNNKKILFFPHKFNRSVQILPSTDTKLFESIKKAASKLREQVRIVDDTNEDKLDAEERREDAKLEATQEKGKNDTEVLTPRAECKEKELINALQAKGDETKKLLLENKVEDAKKAVPLMKWYSQTEKSTNLEGLKPIKVKSVKDQIASKNKVPDCNVVKKVISKSETEMKTLKIESNNIVEAEIDQIMLMKSEKESIELSREEPIDLSRPKVLQDENKTCVSTPQRIQNLLNSSTVNQEMDAVEEVKIDLPLMKMERSTPAEAKPKSNLNTQETFPLIVDKKVQSSEDKAWKEVETNAYDDDVTESDTRDDAPKPENTSQVLQDHRHFIAEIKSKLKPVVLDSPNDNTEGCETFINISEKPASSRSFLRTEVPNDANVNGIIFNFDPKLNELISLQASNASSMTISSLKVNCDPSNVSLTEAVDKFIPFKNKDAQDGVEDLKVLFNSSVKNADVTQHKSGNGGSCDGKSFGSTKIEDSLAEFTEELRLVKLIESEDEAFIRLGQVCEDLDCVKKVDVPKVEPVVTTQHQEKHYEEEESVVKGRKNVTNINPSCLNVSFMGPIKLLKSSISNWGIPFCSEQQKPSVPLYLSVKNTSPVHESEKKSKMTKTAKKYHYETKIIKSLMGKPISVTYLVEDPEE